jgi:hypothetical protein
LYKRLTYQISYIRFKRPNCTSRWPFISLYHIIAAQQTIQLKKENHMNKDNRSNLSDREKEYIAARDYADYMCRPIGDREGDWDCGPKGELSEQATILWNEVLDRLDMLMLDKNEAARISENTGISLIDLYSLAYRVRMPDENELLQLCDQLIME